MIFLLGVVVGVGVAALGFYLLMIWMLRGMWR